jgi:uncharacterized protein YabN with tetrapyrrole methylase and pyrophosphatase domain
VRNASPGDRSKRGSLVIVGTGIQFGAHLTVAARRWIEAADKVLFIAADPATAEWVRRANNSAETLRLGDFATKTHRTLVYERMAEYIMSYVRQGLTVCAAFYGHPGILVAPAHEAIQRARAEGFPARLLPAISAQDCLFADLEIDPAQTGWHSFDATDFLVHRRRADPSSALVLWQIGMVGNPYYRGYDARGLAVLVEELTAIYGSEHQVVVYEAAVYPICDPIIHRLPLGKLSTARITEASLLYVPPKDEATLDLKMMIRLASEAVHGQEDLPKCVETPAASSGPGAEP